MLNNSQAYQLLYIFWQKINTSYTNLTKLIILSLLLKIYWRNQNIWLQFILIAKYPAHSYTLIFMCLHHLKYSITFLPLMLILSPAFSTSTSFIHAFFRTSFTFVLSRKLNQHLFSVLPTYCSMQFIFSFLPHTSL